MTQSQFTNSSQETIDLLLRICAVCWYQRSPNSDVASLGELVRDSVVELDISQTKSEPLSQAIGKKFMSDSESIFVAETAILLRRASGTTREVLAPIVLEIIADTGLSNSEPLWRIRTFIEELKKVTALHSVQPTAVHLAPVIQMPENFPTVLSTDTTPTFELEGESEPLDLTAKPVDEVTPIGRDAVDTEDDEVVGFNFAPLLEEDDPAAPVISSADDDDDDDENDEDKQNFKLAFTSDNKNEVASQFTIPLDTDEEEEVTDLQLELPKDEKEDSAESTLVLDTDESGDAQDLKLTFSSDQEEDDSDDLTLTLDTDEDGFSSTLSLELPEEDDSSDLDSSGGSGKI